MRLGRAVIDRGSCLAIGRSPRPQDGGVVHKAGCGRPVAGTSSNCDHGRPILGAGHGRRIQGAGRGRPILGAGHGR